jgi:ketosteroid isomerase-like protein
MPKSKQRVLLAGGSAQETEAAFYEALQKGDLELLMACWAQEDEIVCVHPGGPRLLGHGAIRSAFETLFANGGLPVTPQRVQRTEGLASAVHSVLERVELGTAEGLQLGWVVATNVYQNTTHGWRLVAHHASQGPENGAGMELEVHAPASLLH